MKKIFLLLAMLVCVPTTLIQAQPEALLPMPTEAEMKEIQQFLDTLSPEELDELAKIGEEIIQTAEAEGRPLFGPAPTAPAQAPKQQPASKPAEKTSDKKEPQKPTEPVLSNKEKTKLQKILTTLIEAIASIRQKAASDEKMLELIAPLNGPLSDLTYYLNVINYSKHLVHLTDKEFTPLQNNLKSLSEQLDDIDNALEIPELEVGKKLTSTEQKKRREKLKEAERLLNKFMDIVQLAIDQKHVMTDFERLLKKYEPEALKIKQDQEAKAKQAREQKNKLPTTNTGIVSAGGRSFGGPATQQYTGGRPPASGGSPFYQSYSSSPTQPQKPGATPAAKPAGAVNKPGATPAKPEDKKKEDPKKATKANDLTAIEQSEQAFTELKKNLKHINTGIGSNRDRFHSFVDNYLATPAGAVVDAVSNEMSELFDEASFALSRVKKEVTNWLGKVNKHTTTAKEYKKHVNKLKEFMQNEMKDTMDLHEKIKAQKTRLPNTARTQKHQGHIGQFNKRIEEIYKELDKPL